MMRRQSLSAGAAPFTVKLWRRLEHRDKRRVRSRVVCPSQGCELELPAWARRTGRRALASDRQIKKNNLWIALCRVLTCII